MIIQLFVKQTIIRDTTRRDLVNTTHNLQSSSEVIWRCGYLKIKKRYREDIGTSAAGIEDVTIVSQDLSQLSEDLDLRLCETIRLESKLQSAVEVKESIKYPSEAECVA